MNDDRNKQEGSSIAYVVDMEAEEDLAVGKGQDGMIEE